MNWLQEETSNARLCDHRSESIHPQRTCLQCSCISRNSKQQPAWFQILPAWAFDNEPVKNKQKTLGEVPILTLGTHFQCLREVMSTESRSLRCQALESIVSFENPHIPVKSCKSVSSYKSYTGWWWLVVLTILKNMKVNGKDYPIYLIYHGK